MTFLERRFHNSPLSFVASARHILDHIFLQVYISAEVEQWDIYHTPLPSPISAIVCSMGILRFFRRACFRSNSSISGSFLYPVKAAPP